MQSVMGSTMVLISSTIVVNERCLPCSLSDYIIPKAIDTIFLFKLKQKEQTFNIH